MANAQYQPTSATQIPAREGSLQDVLSKLAVICEQQRTLAVNLDEIGDRAFGPAPTPLSGDKSPSQPKPAGLSHQIAGLLMEIVELQGRMNDAISRVSSAV